MDLFKSKKLDFKKMRILQLIDSLESGGAERIAVNYANALAGRVSFSGLVTTRKEGVLVHQLKNQVSYLFLNRKGTFDANAVFRLKSFIKKNKIAIVHAHGTSFFIAVLLKLIYPQIKIIWHEHYGARVQQSRMDNITLFFSSVFFSSVFVVNHQLEAWVKNKLAVKNVFCIPNFTTFETENQKLTSLKGNKDKRIVCLANLKNPKNHLVLLTAFNNMKIKDLGWSLHLIGKDYQDEYSTLLKQYIKFNSLENHIFIYGSRTDIQHILSQAIVGMLVSTAEGFPVTLLEYGLAKLPVISTNVGYCPLIVKDNFSGLLFDPLRISQLEAQLSKIISEKELRESFGLHLYKEVLENYSKESVLKILLSKYSSF